MNYLDTHDSVYLRYGDNRFGLEYRAKLICLQGFQRKHQHDGKLEKFFKCLFVLLRNYVFFKLKIYISSFNKYISINICYLISYV